MADARSNLLPLGEALLEVVESTAAYIERRAGCDPWHSETRTRLRSRLAQVIALEVAEEAARRAAERAEERVWDCVGRGHERGR